MALRNSSERRFVGHEMEMMGRVKRDYCHRCTRYSTFAQRQWIGFI